MEGPRSSWATAQLPQLEHKEAVKYLLRLFSPGSGLSDNGTAANPH